MKQKILELLQSHPNATSTEIQVMLSKLGHTCTSGYIRKLRCKQRKSLPSINEEIVKQREAMKVKQTAHSDKKKIQFLIEQNEQLEKEKEVILLMQENLKPYVFTYKESTKDNEAVAFVLASDWHLEEIVNPVKVNGLNQYNLRVAEERAKQFFQNTAKLLKKEQHATKIDTLVVALLGDFISSNIHDELLENCSLRPMEAIIFAENLLIGGINYLLENTDVNLIIPCSVGNHTRITRRVHISTEQGNSLETFMYHHMANYFKGNSRVEFLISESYLQYLEVYGYTVCFQHGHAVRYAGGIGGLSIPLNKAIAQWQKLRHADMYCMGHWHSFLDNGNAIVNGSLIGYNAFAVFIKANFEKPKQAFFLVDKKRKCKTVTTPILFDI
jgi:hypothetical protein